MNRSEAIQMRDWLREIGGLQKVQINHHGFYSTLTPEIENDGNWQVEVWHRNPKSGVVDMSQISDFSVDAGHLAAIARHAKGKATAADRRAFDLMRAERENV